MHEYVDVCISVMIYTAGAVVCAENIDSDSVSHPPFPMLEAIDIVAERLLEYVPLIGSEKVSVQGRLHRNASFWLNELEASSFVRNTIFHGYRIPFVALPWPVFKFNHRSALEQSKFVSEAIRELVDTGCVISSLECPAVCSPLSVVENAKGKLRLVLDLRYVNQFLPELKFKYEGLSLVPQMFEKGDHFFNFDLKSGYHHVCIIMLSVINSKTKYGIQDVILQQLSVNESYVTSPFLGIVFLEV